MSTQTSLFLAGIVVFVASLVIVALYFVRRAHRVSSGSWEQLLKRLAVVDRDGVARVASDYVDDFGRRKTSESDADLEPRQIWNLVGGLEGLETLERNCPVLIDLASYVQQWYPEAVVLAEELRLNAREIEWHVERLRGASKSGNLELYFADYAQPAVVKYYQMTQRVLALYERGGLPMLVELEKAL